MWEWMRTTYLEPAIKRRQEAGEFSEGTVISLAQVVFWSDRDAVEVRFNEEVRGEAQVQATGPIERGQPITTADFDSVVSYLLPDEDGDAAHVTMFMTRSGVNLVFDAAYNALRIQSQIEVADEFAEIADVALKEGLLRPFAENAFAACELLANAELLSLPDKRVRSKTHGTIKALYNQWARLGNAEPHFANLLNGLGELRDAARYLRSEFDLDLSEAREHFGVLREMRQHVEENRPKRDLEAKEPSSYRVVAIRDLRAGELVGPGDTVLFK